MFRIHHLFAPSFFTTSTEYLVTKQASKIKLKGKANPKAAAIQK